MKDGEITVFYKWTAKEGKFEELKAKYEVVYQAMKDNEPGSLKMECYILEDENAILVHDLFQDGNALGVHLMGTAAMHFPSLLQIATPGPFFFCGEVPAELKQAAKGMNMGAEFARNAFGFDRREQ